MPVTLEFHNTIAVISINNPPVNALSHAVRQGLQDAIRKAQNGRSEAIVIQCQGRTFVAGADIKEFGKAPKEPWLPDLLHEVEASAIPVVAALHGTILGGGLELALASHYRIAEQDAKLGLPEVKLGLLPGAGGTQRLPRLVGVKAALDMISSGTPVSAADAASLGLVDQVVTANLPQAALDFAKQLLATGAGVRRSSERPAPEAAPDIFDRYRKQLARRARGQLAPQKIVDCVEASVSLPFAEGMDKERRAFIECMASPESAGMRHLFFAEREAAKVRGLSKDTAKRDIQTLAVIGGGTMGSGIAMNFATAGLSVILLEINDDALAHGMDIIAKNYAAGVERGKLSQQEADAARGRIGGTTQYSDLGDADLIIEAVYENLDLKQEIFAKLDEVAKPGAILATNTSYQDVNAIAAATGRPADVIGLHFFSPAHIMKLLEIVRAEKTADEVLSTCIGLARKIRKVPVVAGVCYGFIGNRMLQHYGREAQLCLIEGASPVEIDTAMEEWGMAMGPMRVFDLAGLDVGYKARQGLDPAQRGDPKAYRIPDALVEAGRLGRKSGAGFYCYDPATGAYEVDEVARQLIEAEAAALGVQRRALDSAEIVDRLIFALINEGIKVVDEGIAQRPSDIDVVYVYGYGFPAHRGGPMHYADAIGLEKVYARICEFRERFGAEHWTPAPLLERLVTEGVSLDDWNSLR